MKLSSFLVGATAIASTSACPGTDGTMKDLNNALKARASVIGPNDSFEMIGDLATKGATTATGKTVKSILDGTVDPYSDEQFFDILWPKSSWLCAQNTCCIWKYVALDMEKKFKGSSGRCNGYARAAVRLGFHDAGAWSKTTGFGGADGSIVLANEGGRPENNGLQEIIVVMQDWYNQYHQYGVGMADLIQMGATVATVVCPLGPRIRSFVGRKDSDTPAAEGLLPNVFSDAGTLISLFQNKTIQPHGLAALVGAHTVSQQRFVDTSRALDPQDSTPGVWDVKFYPETIGNAPKRVFKFQSDIVLSAHPKISDEWAKFAGAGGQQHWNEDFAKEYVRLSLLGVNNINDLKECTKVLPREIKYFINPDQQYIDQWIGGAYQKLGATLREGTTILTSLLKLLGLRDTEAVQARAFNA